MPPVSCVFFFRNHPFKRFPKILIPLVNLFKFRFLKRTFPLSGFNGYCRNPKSADKIITASRCVHTTFFCRDQRVTCDFCSNFRQMFFFLKKSSFSSIVPVNQTSGGMIGNTAVGLNFFSQLSKEPLSQVRSQDICL